MNAPKVKVIQVRKKATATAAPEKKSLLKVAAYCRVSTEHEEQESSYEAQCTHYESFIKSNPEWELAGIYADEGLSGTGTAKRTEFKRLIEDCMAGKVQMVITKSISRFARNTLDCLQYIRKLKAKGIPILFEKENILTTDSKGEVLITIMASLAQQESASISQNVQLGVRYHYAQGKVGAGHQRFLGYERTEDASLRIVPEEASIVRRIFREYLEGDSPGLIAKRLTDERVTWRCNKTGKWIGQTLKYMLQNEKYAGNLLLQKYHTVDFLTKKVERNNGAVPQYYVENSHPPIVPYEVFLQVQGDMMRRGAAYPNLFKANDMETKLGKSQERKAKLGLPRVSNFRALTGRLFCCECGDFYKRKLEGKKHVWRCNPTRGDKECGNRPVDETVVQQAIVEAFNRLPEERENLHLLRDQIERGLLTHIDAQLAVMDEDDPGRPQLIMQRAEYAQMRLRVMSLLAWLDGTAHADGQSPVCSGYDDFVNRTHRLSQGYPMTSFCEEEAIRYMEKAVVHPDKLEVVIYKRGFQSLRFSLMMEEIG